MIPSDDGVVARLAGLCRLWGVVKHFHPFPAYLGEVDWDGAVLQAIPAVRGASGPEAYAVALAAALTRLGDPHTHLLSPDGVASTPEEDHLPSLRQLSGGAAALVVPNVRRLTEPQHSRAFVMALEDGCAACALVIDARLPPGLPEGSAVPIALRDCLLHGLPSLLDRDVQAGGARHRQHLGFIPQGGGPENQFIHRWQVRPGQVLSGRAAHGRCPALVLLVNAHTENVEDLLGGVQAAGCGRVVSSDGSCGGTFDPSIVDLADGLRVRVCTSQYVQPDGQLGLRPDACLGADPGMGPEEDPDGAAYPAALAAASAASDLPARATPLSGLVTGVPSERPLNESLYPTPSQRLFGLFRLWNAIRYFFPYRDLMNTSWDDALAEYIPRVAQAADARSYHLAIAEITTRTCDTHVTVSSAVLRQHWGEFHPPVIVRTVEGRTLVVAVEDLAGDDRVQPGDEVLAVDGKPVRQLRGQMRPYLPASTPQALEWDMDWRMLGGSRGSKACLTVRGRNGTREVQLERNRHGEPERPARLPTWTVLPEGFGYVDLTRLEPEDVDRALDAVRDAPAVIFDVRGYPKGTAWPLGPRLCHTPVRWATFACPVVSGPREVRFLTLTETVRPAGRWQYAGRVVGLINSDAYSQAEHTALLLRVLGGTLVGTPTSGCNGDVTRVALPGRIGVWFSGQAVLFPDGRQFQRVGVQPDIVAEVTAEGLRAGRDEVLDTAVRWLHDTRQA